MEGRAYKLSDALDSIIDNVTHKEKELIAEMMDHYIDMYKNLCQNHKAHNVAYSMASHIDDLIAEMPVPENEKISCKKGCAACCHINVDISKEEALLILGYCKDENINIYWPRLIKQSNYDAETYFNLPVEKRKCVFLSEDKTCRIYDIRPIACRKFHSMDDPAKCDLDNGKRVVKRFVAPKAEMVACAIMTCAEFDSLPKLLLKYGYNNKKRKRVLGP